MENQTELLTDLQANAFGKTVLQASSLQVMQSEYSLVDPNLNPSRKKTKRPGKQNLL